MLKNKELHDFLCERTKKLTEQWYETLDKNAGGLYSSTDPETIETLKQQNHEFHLRFCAMFEKDDPGCLKDFQDWIMHIARDEGHLATPLTAVLKEFFRTQKQYLELIDKFISIREEPVSNEQREEWKQAVVTTINEVVLEFTIQNANVAEKRLQAQQAMIVEMSAPVILLTKETGLLPLIGEIDTYRSQIIFEQVLEQCYQNSLERLFIDLSGVPIIDTMVAHRVFQLIEGLRLIGVKAALSGFSPAIAQTSIQLGLNFGKIEVYSTLAQAMKGQHLNFKKESLNISI